MTYALEGQLGGMFPVLTLGIAIFLLTGIAFAGFMAVRVWRGAGGCSMFKY